jgi:hypothetical protein
MPLLSAGMTHKVVAKKAKITPAALSQIEKADNELRTAILEGKNKCQTLNGE